ncbi:MAG TPA: peptidoglycan-binding protein [Anaerolineales bacterium]|nr:peptidoglycan-binding protein [Anaerolineales bacterium]
MQNKFQFGILALTLAMLACNLGTPAGVPTSTFDATQQAQAILATGFAQLTSSASAPIASPTETPTPLNTVAATSTNTALLPLINPNTPIPSATNTSPVQVPDWPLFRQGDQGPEVRAIQHLLRFKGQNVDVDGNFGAQTRTAVIAFQNQSGLSPDGIVGPLTWSALIQGAQVQEGSTSQAVRAAQTLLRNKFGYSIDVDGIFGQQTENAARDFQTSHGLLVDGIIGLQTWQALVTFQP